MINKKREERINRFDYKITDAHYMIDDEKYSILPKRHKVFLIYRKSDDMSRYDIIMRDRIP